MFALVDCNNFFVSCERMFNPKLENIPVIVLSNNDGCIIARSNEAKALGIKMGEPFFKAKDIIEKNDVKFFSSNYHLYGDFSNRVIKILQDSAPEVEVYSIDEVFLDIRNIPNSPEEFAKNIREKIKKWVGIPVSVGIGKTKTLAKIANNIAKKKPNLNGVLYLDNPKYTERALKITKIEDVWGVGRAWSKQLKNIGVISAFDFTQLDDRWIKKSMKIVGLRMANELRGIQCYNLETNPDAKKSITVSRSFAKKLEESQAIEKMLSSYIKRAGEKLRKENLAAKYMQIYLTTGRHANKTYSNLIGIELYEETSYTPELITIAKALFKKIYKDGYIYKKCGVIFSNLYPASIVKKDLFDERDLIKRAKLMSTIDFINKKMGKNTIRYAAENFDTSFKGKSENLSQRFTDRWDQLLKIV